MILYKNKKPMYTFLMSLVVSSRIITHQCVRLLWKKGLRLDKGVIQCTRMERCSNCTTTKNKTNFIAFCHIK